MTRRPTSSRFVGNATKSCTGSPSFVGRMVLLLGPQLAVSKPGCVAQESGRQDHANAGILSIITRSWPWSNSLHRTHSGILLNWKRAPIRIIWRRADGHGGFDEKQTHGMTRHIRRVRRASETQTHASLPRSESCKRSTPAHEAGASTPRRNPSVADRMFCDVSTDSRMRGWLPGLDTRASLLR
jgi:hypothetical protein